MSIANMALPTAGDDFVLMRDANKVWRCLEDKCSHRQGL